MNAVMILLLFSVGMFAIPLSGYYFSKTYILEGILGYSNATVGAGIIALVLVHVVVAAYIYVAWIEGAEREDRLKED
ncbi:hypothetical protein EMCRGX_G033683 [Ephydatia muelleri]|eukprot:Em0022g509a